MQTWPQVIVLLGPNGAGKSTLGRALHARGLCTFLDLENFFVERYGSVERYCSHRHQVYIMFEEYVREEIAHAERPVVFEEVGLSSEAENLMQSLRADFLLLTICVMVDSATCAQCVSDRTLEGRFPKSLESVAVVHRRFVAEVMPRHDHALSLRTDWLDPQELCSLVAELLRPESLA